MYSIKSYKWKISPFKYSFKEKPITTSMYEWMNKRDKNMVSLSKVI